jgi:GntR family transcriptional regulator
VAAVSERTPLHAQVEGALRERLRSRDLRPGDLFPSEAALQAEFDVSRSVVRQALATLEAEGLIRKVRGKGSVVAEHREVHRDVLRSGLRLEAGSEGAVTTRVESYDVVPRPDHLASILGDRVLQVGRVRSVGGVVLSYIRTWLPEDVADAIGRDDLTDASIHQLLAERLGRRVVGGRHQVRAVLATTALADLLGVETGAPLLLLEGRTVDADGVALEEFSTWHRGDLVAFDVDAVPPAVREDTGDERIERLARTARDLLAELEQLR